MNANKRKQHLFARECFCGKASIGSVNGFGFCNDPDHIDKAVSRAAKPIQRLIKVIREQALLDFTEKFVTDHPQDYEGPCLCEECKENQ